MIVPRPSLSLAALAGLSLFGVAGCVFEGSGHGYGGYNGGNDNAYNGANGQHRWYQSNSGGNYSENSHSGFGG